MQAVRSEPVSADFPVKQGINREFSRNRPIMTRIGRSNGLISQGYFAEISTQRNREIFWPNREFKLPNRELIARSANRPPRSPAGSNRGLDATFTELRQNGGDVRHRGISRARFQRKGFFSHKRYETRFAISSQFILTLPPAAMPERPRSLTRRKDAWQGFGPSVSQWLATPPGDNRDTIEAVVSNPPCMHMPFS